MGEGIPDRRGTFFLSLIVAGTLLSSGWTEHGIALAGQKPEASTSQEEKQVTASGEAAEYHTPLAGEPFKTVIMGKSLLIPAQDRTRVTALTLGGAFYFPEQGKTSATPIGAFYLKRVWDESRTRNQISIFVYISRIHGTPVSFAMARREAA